MERTAKIFRKGFNQAVSLPPEFEFDTENVYIRRDERGNVVLFGMLEKMSNAEKIKNRDRFLSLLAKTSVPNSFLSKEERKIIITGH